MNTTCLQRYDVSLEPWQVSLIWSFTVSIFCIGGLLGSLVAGPLITKFGRSVQTEETQLQLTQPSQSQTKLNFYLVCPVFLMMASGSNRRLCLPLPCRKRCLLLNNFVAIIGAVLMLLSKTAMSFEMIMVGRFLYGINSGEPISEKSITSLFFSLISSKMASPSLLEPHLTPQTIDSYFYLSLLYF